MAKETQSKKEAGLRPSQNTATLERPANFPAPYVRHIPRRRSMRDQAQELAQKQAEAERRAGGRSRAESPDTRDSDTTINKGEAQKMFEDAGLGESFNWAWENAIQGIRGGSGRQYEVEEAAVQTAIATMTAYEAEKDAETDEGGEGEEDKDA